MNLNKSNWMLTKIACLEHNSKHKENMVSTDANTTGLGNTLWQKHDSGKRKSIAEGSRYLNATKKDTQ